MSQQERPERIESEWRQRLASLQNVPQPNLARGRAHVLALAQSRMSAAPVPPRATFALALCVGLSVMLVMVVMSTAIGALPIASVALTRTDSIQSRTSAPIVIPANAVSPKFNDTVTLRAPHTPAPNVVPEPPRSPSLSSTQTLAP